MEKAKQKDPERYETFRCHAHAALDEYVTIREKRDSTSDLTEKKRLTTLLERKKVDVDDAMNGIAAIAGKPLDVAPRPCHNTT